MKITLKWFLATHGIRNEDLKVDGKRWGTKTYYRMIQEKGYYSRMRMNKKESIAKSLGITEKQLKKLVNAHFTS